MVLQKSQNFFLYLYVFSLVFESWNMMSFGGNSLPKFIGYVLFFLILVDKNLYSIRHINRFLLPINGFLMVLVISILINLENGPDWFWRFQSIFLNILFFSLVLLIVAKRPKTGYFMFIALNAGIFLATFFYLAGIGVEFVDGRLTIFGENANKIGVLAVINTLFIFSVVFENKKAYGKKRFLLFIMLIPLLNMIALSGSRVTFLGFMLSLVLFFLLRRKRGFIQKMGIYLTGSLVIFMAFNYLMEFEVLQSRMLQSIEYGHISGRDRIWEWLVPELYKKPFFGMGINGYIELSSNYFGWFFSPHNVFLEIIAYSGIIGLSVFGLFYFRITTLAWKLIKNSNYVMPIVLLTFIFFVFFSGQGIDVKPFWIVYLFVIGEYLNFRNNVKPQSVNQLTTSPAAPNP